MNAIGASLLGVQTAQNQFYAASTAFVNSFTPVLAASAGDAQALANLTNLPEVGANPFAGDNLGVAAFLASAQIGIFEAAASPEQAFMNLMTAQYAFTANLEGFKTAASMQEQLVNILA